MNYAMDGRSRTLLASVAAMAVSVGPYAHAGDIADIIRDLYGGDGINLSQASGFGHDAHFTSNSLAGLDDLGASIGAGIGHFAFNGVSPSFTIDLETGVPIRSNKSLGPLLADTALTNGAHTLTIGASYTRVDYDRFEGDKLDDLELILRHPDSNGDGQLAPFVPFPGGPLLDFELDQVRLDIDLDLTQDIFAFFANYGITDDWDVGIIVPIVHVQAKATSVASIVDGTPGTPTPHFFDGTSEDPVSTLRRDATGFGDVLLRTKYNLTKDDETLPDFALGSQIILPTGDADDLLGSDEVFIQFVMIASKAFWRITPHLNLGYEWSPTEWEQSNLRFVAGADGWINEYVTLSGGVLGRWEHDGDRIGDKILDATLGVRAAIFERTVLNVNARTPLNRAEGLRADLVFSVGVEQAF